MGKAIHLWNRQSRKAIYLQSFWQATHVHFSHSKASQIRTFFSHRIRDTVYQNHLNQQSEKGESKMDVDDDRHVMVDLWLSPLAWSHFQWLNLLPSYKENYSVGLSKFLQSRFTLQSCYRMQYDWLPCLQLDTVSCISCSHHLWQLGW